MASNAMVGGYHFPFPAFGRMVAQGPMDRLAAEKLGIGQEIYTLEEIYMKYFREA